MKPVRPVTIRRFLVVGTCAFGVACLYLAPSVARSPDQAGSRASDEQPISRPSTTAEPVAVQSTGRATPNARAETSRSPEPADSTDEATSRSATEPKPKPKSSRSGATAFDAQQPNRDETPPDPVGGIRFGPVTPAELTVRWAPGHDDTGVVGYRLWLDGFTVATTARTEVTVKWFNDDLGQHVIQLKALDAAGNLSMTAQSVLVTRPTPEPTPQPSPEPTGTPSETPTAPGKSKPGGKPSDRPHKSNGDG
jgi:hypothetical protein